MSAARTVAVQAAPASSAAFLADDGPMIDQAGGQKVVERATEVAAVPVGALGDFCGHDSRLLCRGPEDDDARPLS